MHSRQRKSLELYLKLVRHPGSPESIGRGVAAGLFSAFIIPAGHMLLAWPLAAAARGARGTAMLVTWIINPLTIPVIYPAQCYAGSLLTGHPLSIRVIHQTAEKLLTAPSWSALRTTGTDLIAAFFAGGALFGAAAATAGYFLSLRLTRRFRLRRQTRRQRHSSTPFHKGEASCI